ncbi:HIT domain-containing protein [Fervidicoccus fontis]|jgi:ATP adenylyltransferase|uniref:HIT domain-containing protein n=1 Tax=Fervidicoccus fontis TaxID=683846 RepID=A0A2J6N7P5_9CREN|nr:HIT domain-containing protein [Fervidicoccus fontis]MBE9391477.1 HIT domain-containing protein [Fervidicoccus fontis]PMB75483.1 MAG: HIT family hydrolase [Fervidicoccus fontis]PMB77348.1 MAG: HIT family hydrolase [Fervidicoccus fontis]HEW64074.1 HIT domain-containing protein [Fervidicoccus fontis]
MKILWAPWRSVYIKEISKEEKGSCIFCKAIAEKDDNKNLVVFRGNKTFVIMNKYPYNSGHLMVVPYKHVSRIENLDNEELLELSTLIVRSVKVLTELYRPDGFNIGMNIGRAAGAGIEDHIHVHIVPRWIGDTNFMPVIGETRVISENLTEAYAKIKEAFQKIK